jgi:MFS family permease
MSRDPRLVLVACCLAMLAVGENSTAIMAALPAMSSGLGLGPATVEWAVNAYLLAAAAFIILGGQAVDVFGPRCSSAAGIVLFALASLILVNSHPNATPFSCAIATPCGVAGLGLST